MKNIIFLIQLGAIILFSSCSKAESTKINKPVTERNPTFNKEGFSLGKVFCPYSDKELTSLLAARQKAAWPRIKVSATFAGFITGPDNPCKGCANCGCCVGLCIEISRGIMTNTPLTKTEVNHQMVLFEFIDDPVNQKITLIPSNNIDNGDGWLHVTGDVSFSREICTYIGRDVTLKNGSYEIKYLPGYVDGVVVINTL